MIKRLRSHQRTSGVGIVMSGWHIIAVTINGPEMRHPPVPKLHDGSEPKDGVLLFMHLLSPTFTALKTPWHAELVIHRPQVSAALPDDVLRHIIHFTDLETYLSLRPVSRCVRLICLTYPRVGHHILLSYKANTKSEPMFRVLSTHSTYSTVATLTRIKSSLDKRTPIWNFRWKSHVKWYLNPGLAGTFQYHQSRLRPLDTRVGEENN
ncbi:hypothetical protein B0J17DRAFT_222875 [Rhizoctonia solani]|nr:hypothetical protein B0J17DRAFT_222875 [Rhizoctonia solani]